MLHLVSKIATSDGIGSRRTKRAGDSIKSVQVIKKDILEPFKRAYPWYFHLEADGLTPLSPPIAPGFMAVIDQDSSMVQPFPREEDEDF